MAAKQASATAISKRANSVELGVPKQLIPASAHSDLCKESVVRRWFIRPSFENQTNSALESSPSVIGVFRRLRPYGGETSVQSVTRGERYFDQRRRLDRSGRDDYVVRPQVEHRIGTGVGDKIETAAALGRVEVNLAEVWQL